MDQLPVRESVRFLLSVRAAIGRLDLGDLEDAVGRVLGGGPSVTAGSTRSCVMGSQSALGRDCCGSRSVDVGLVALERLRPPDALWDADGKGRAESECVTGDVDRKGKARYSNGLDTCWRSKRLSPPSSAARTAGSYSLMERRVWGRRRSFAVSVRNIGSLRASLWGACANVLVRGLLCGGRGTRTHKPFRATVFKSVNGSFPECRQPAWQPPFGWSDEAVRLPCTSGCSGFFLSL
jgi:hypothetical protein